MDDILPAIIVTVAIVFILAMALFSRPGKSGTAFGRRYRRTGSTGVASTLWVFTDSPSHHHGHNDSGGGYGGGDGGGFSGGFSGGDSGSF